MKASMKPAASLCLVVAVILGSILVSPAGAQVIDRTGNLRADVFDNLTFPSRDSDQYCLPTPGSLGAPGDPGGVAASGRCHAPRRSDGRRERTPRLCPLPTLAAIV